MGELPTTFGSLSPAMVHALHARLDSLQARMDATEKQLEQVRTESADGRAAVFKRIDQMVEMFGGHTSREDGRWKWIVCIVLSVLVVMALGPQEHTWIAETALGFVGIKADALAGLSPQLRSSIVVVLLTAGGVYGRDIIRKKLGV